MLTINNLKCSRLAKMKISILKCKICGEKIRSREWSWHLREHNVEVPEKPWDYPMYIECVRANSKTGFQEWVKQSSKAWKEYRKKMATLKKQYFEKAGFIETPSSRECFYKKTPTKFGLIQILK